MPTNAITIRIERLYDLTIRRLLFICFAVMVAVTFTGTLFRYLPGVPGIHWAEEVTRYLNIWTVFLASGLAINRGAHMGVDAFVRLLPEKPRKIVTLFGLTAMLIFEAILLYYGVMMTRANMDQLSSALELPMGWPFLAIPVGGGLMIVETLRKIIQFSNC